MLTLLFIVAILVLPISAQATTIWTPGTPLIPCNGADSNSTGPFQPGQGPCNFDSLIQLAFNLISLLMYISVPIAAISFSYAGFLYLTAAGDTGKIKEAHKIFWKVLMGFIFVFAAWLIVWAIISALLAPGYSLLG